MERILVTGGAGYIGSHTVVELLTAGYDVTVIDNFSNSGPDALKRIKAITGKDFDFVQGDVRDQGVLQKIFNSQNIYAVIHFAGFKAVGESVKEPLSYYNNNLFSAIALLEVMKKNNCKNFLFSSSATVYKDGETLPLIEDCVLQPKNPYGMTKLMIEMLLKDLYVSDKHWNIAILRYFNPIGAHKSGLLGEEPNGIPNNLLPYIANVATGKSAELKVYGNDYPTSDGTGKRDYIHVVDLALGHLAALKKIEGMGYDAYNLGTGKSYSVLEIVAEYESACGKKIPYSIVGRREGDIAECFADCTKAEKLLGFKAAKSLADMCNDTVNYSKTKR
ncbi:udp-glucose 4-epimerase [Holotrichia oblita]|nr:udp-glucose 4-epimerase [Holotrichia oblita]